MAEPLAASGGRRDRRGGGEDPFVAFYRTRFAAAVRLAVLLTGDQAAAEDVAQDAFARVRPRFAGLDAPWPYLRVTIVNGCRSGHRRANREAARLRTVGPAGPAPLGALELLDAVDRLPYRQKAVLVLRFYEDMTEHDIAAALGVRPGTVKSLASRALARLSTEVPR